MLVDTIFVCASGLYSSPRLLIIRPNVESVQLFSRLAWLRALAGCASGVASASGPEVSLPARGGRFDGRAGKRAAGVAAGLARGAGVTSADRAPKPSADPGSSASFPMKGMAIEGKHLASQ